MRTQRSGLIRFILILAGVFILVRYLPLVARMVQVMAIGSRAFWWAVLPAAICAWLVWKLKRRSRLADKSQPLFDRRPLRDVTNSFKG